MLSSQTSIELLDDRAHGPDSGFAATVFPLVLVVRKAPPQPGAAVRVRLATITGDVLTGAVPQPELALDAARGAPWLALPESHLLAVRSSLAAGQPLSSRFRPRLGVKTGANGIFMRPAVRADELPASHRLPAILGRDITPFHVRPSAAVLVVVGRDGRPLHTADRQVLEFLAPHRRRLERRTDARSAPLWAVFRTDLLGGRWLVVWRDIAPRLEAAVVERPGNSGPVPMNSCYGVIAPDAFSAHWLAAFLNSTTARGIAAALAERAAGGCFRFDARTVGAVPLPEPSDPHLPALAAIARAAADNEPWDQHELDHLAARALAIDTSVVPVLGTLAPAVR
jgi:hypothetical protein